MASPDDLSARWDRVGEVFEAALDLPTAERETFLDEACAGDPALRAEVESLLAVQPAAEASFQGLAAAAGPVLGTLGAAGDPPPDTLRRGDVVGGHYEIRNPLGTGGMGTVYRAHDTRLERTVALKFLHADRAADPEARARLLREARAVAALDHPHLCAVHGIEDTDDGLFVVMPCYEGETLRARLRRGPLPLDEALAIAEQVAAGLGAAHAEGVTHRDLKPSNVMLTPGADGPHVRLLDFGIAHLAHDRRLTRTGHVLGTVGYLAPERLRRAPADARADLWALGVLLYEMLAGRPPFEGDTEASLLYAVLEADPPPLDTSVPGGVTALVDRLLQKVPEDRYPSAEVVRADLVRLRAGEVIAPSPVRSSPASRWKWVVLGVSALVLLTAAVWLGRSLLAPEPEAPQTVAVLPFAVRGGPELGYLREGLVDLLAAQLDGVGGIRSVDPNVVLGRVPSGEVLTLEEARAAADRLGAGRFVLGSATDTGGGLRLLAALYHVDGTEEARAQADADSPEALLPALDRLSHQLVAAQLTDPDEQLASAAALTTTSFPALRAYLDGEQALRATRFDDAEAAFGRAVVADSTFALAWYRLARATGWTGDAALNRRATRRARALAGGLPARLRDVIEGYYAFRMGDAVEAERRYRAVLARHPDHAEAWLLLSELLFHYNPYAGRATAEALDPLTRALGYAPDDHELLVHLMDLALQRGDRVALDSLTARYFRSGDAEPELALPYRTARARVLGDTAEYEAALARLRAAGPGATRQTLERAAAMLGDLSFARPLAQVLAAADDEEARVWGSLHLALFDVAEGEWAAADAHFDRAAGLAPGWALIHRVLAAVAPHRPASDERLRVLRADVEAWAPPDSLFDGQHVGELGAVRRYLLGLLDLRLAREAEALAQAAALEEDGEAFPASLAATLRAYADLEAGRPEAALERLDAATLALPFPVRRTSPLYGQHLGRLLRAEVLRELGRTAEAERWAASLHDGYFWWGVPYRTPE
jgi:serine/threonine-protein kinase